LSLSRERLCKYQLDDLDSQPHGWLANSKEA